MARIDIQVNGEQLRDNKSLHGTLESLEEMECNSMTDSDLELNGFSSTDKQADKYGFIGGPQQSTGDLWVFICHL